MVFIPGLGERLNLQVSAFYEHTCKKNTNFNIRYMACRLQVNIYNNSSHRTIQSKTHLACDWKARPSSCNRRWRASSKQNLPWSSIAPLPDQDEAPITVYEVYVEQAAYQGKWQDLTSTKPSIKPRLGLLLPTNILQHLEGAPRHHTVTTAV